MEIRRSKLIGSVTAKTWIQKDILKEMKNLRGVT